MIILKNVLAEHGVNQQALANHLNLSAAAISELVNHNRWPKTTDAQLLKGFINVFLSDRGVPSSTIATVFKPVADTDKSANSKLKEIDEMLLRKYTLSPTAKRAFGLVRDPFREVQNADELFLTPDNRYVREALRSAACHGGFVAVVGESGAGKSTLRRDLLDWMQRSNQQVVPIQPYVLGMEDNDIKGKSLKASHIAEAIMATVAAGQSVKRSPEARFRQVHHALRESHRAGNKHVLIIEEAHSLPIPTLKHLKRFFELEDGFSKLLSIVLIGQSELAHKLDERNPSVREVVQRCELVTLQPLGSELEAYLQHRFKQASKPLSLIMDDGAIQALRTKLSGDGYSVLYPLAIHNVLTAAMNDAAEIGLAVLNADLIAEV